MKRRNILTAVTAALISIQMMTVPAMAASWQQSDNGKWYSLDDGSYAIDWRAINGKWYYFNESGYMMTGWFQDNGKWYYLDGDGAMHTSWLELGNKRYYMKEDGSMATGFFRVGYYAYQTNDDGSLIRNKLVNSKMKYDDYGAIMVKDQDGDWSYLPPNSDVETQAKDRILEAYLEHTYANENAFEKDVRDTFKGIWSDSEIQNYIDELNSLFMDYYETDYNHYKG